MFFRRELKNGITLVDEKFNSLNVESKKAAFQGISAVILSRIAMATPGMGTYQLDVLPFVCNKMRIS